MKRTYFAGFSDSNKKIWYSEKGYATKRHAKGIFMSSIFMLEFLLFREFYTFITKVDILDFEVFPKVISNFI